MSSNTNYRQQWAEGEIEAGTLLDAIDSLQYANIQLAQRFGVSHAEAEALRAEIEELDSLRNRQSDLLSQTAIALRGPEPALTRYSHADIPSRVKTVVAELEAARGLLLESREAYTEAIHWEDQQPVMKKIDAFLDATQSPEVKQE